MRKVILLAFMFLLSMSSIAAQAETPLFGVVYPYGSGYRLAIRYSDQTWKIRDIPGIPIVSYEAGGPQANARPFWSPDGKTIYFTGNPPGQTTTAGAVYAYNVDSGAITPILTKPEIGGCSDAFVIESISPDGRYALMCSGFSPQATDSSIVAPSILDLKTGQIMSTDISGNSSNLPLDGYGLDSSGCRVGGDWLSSYQRLIVYSDCGLMTRFPLVTTVDTTTWKTLGQHLTLDMRMGSGELVAKPNPYMLYSYVTDDNSGGEIDVLWLKTGVTQKVSDGNALQIAADGSFAAFINTDRLVRINLSTLALTDTGPIAHPAGDFLAEALGTQGSTLYYLDANDTDAGQIKLALITLTQTRRTEGPTFYTGPAPTRVISDSPYFALDVPGPQHIEVYKYDKRLWSSLPSYPDASLTDLSGAAVTFLTSTSADAITVDAESGTVATPAAESGVPVPVGYQFAGAGIDGWSVYVKTDASSGAESAILFNPQTGESLTLFDADTVINNGNNAPQDLIVWSPPYPQ